MATLCGSAYTDSALGSAVQPNANDLIDLDRYPINQSGQRRNALIAEARAAIDSVGCAVLNGFIRAEHLPTAHPLRRFYDRSNAFVPADHFGDDSLLGALYEWPAFAPFIQEALGEARFHRYADPLADVIVNLAEEGGGFPWHFDTNNYTVTLAIQNAQHGGDFEYSPYLRTPTDENYDGVARVLDGDPSLIRTLRLEPGDLQIFKGRYSLHRVAPLAGSRTRYVAIFSYVEEPGMVGSPERTRQLYGRVLPIHLERAGLRADALVD